MKKENIIIVLIAFTLGLLLSLNNCNKKPNSIIEYKTQIEHFRDTIYLPKEIYIKSNESIARIDENNTYKDSTFKYYNQTFTDSNYVLNTFGGKTDSIHLTFKCVDKIIYDSVKINTTKTIKEVIFKPYKNTLGIEYIRNIDNNIIVDYTRNYGRFGLGVKAGININNKQPLLGVGLKYHF